MAAVENSNVQEFDMELDKVTDKKEKQFIYNYFKILYSNLLNIGNTIDTNKWITNNELTEVEQDKLDHIKMDNNFKKIITDPDIFGDFEKLVEEVRDDYANLEAKQNSVPILTFLRELKNYFERMEQHVHIPIDIEPSSPYYLPTRLYKLIKKQREKVEYPLDNQNKMIIIDLLMSYQEEPSWSSDDVDSRDYLEQYAVDHNLIYPEWQGWTERLHLGKKSRHVKSRHVKSRHVKSRHVKSRRVKSRRVKKSKGKRKTRR